MVRDARYYRKKIALWHFIYRIVYVFVGTVGIGYGLTKILEHMSRPMILPHFWRIFCVLSLAVLAVLAMVPSYIRKLREIDLGCDADDLVCETILNHARRVGLIDENNRLLKPRSKFVNFCIDHQYFYPYGRSEWRQIEEVLMDTEGKPVTSIQLAQTFQDIQTRQGI